MEINSQIILGLILSVLPIFEARAGMPLIIEYSIRNNISYSFYIILAILLNILVIFFVFFFLDFIHLHLMKINIYKSLAKKYLGRLQARVDKTSADIDKMGFLALILFVAIPLPGTGAWSGTIIAWMLGADRLKSYLSISLGVIIAGILLLFASLGFFSFFS